MQYEYAVVTLTNRTVTSDWLNSYGEDGWELAGVESFVTGRGGEDSGHRYIFKRRKFGERVEPRHDPVRPLAHAKKEPVTINYYQATDHMSQHDREAYAEATNR